MEVYDQFHRRLLAVESAIQRSQNAPTVPKYDLTVPTSTPTGFGIFKSEVTTGSGPGEGVGRKGFSSLTLPVYVDFYIYVPSATDTAIIANGSSIGVYFMTNAWDSLATYVDTSEHYWPGWSPTSPSSLMVITTDAWVEITGAFDAVTTSWYADGNLIDSYSTDGSADPNGDWLFAGWHYPTPNGHYWIKNIQMSTTTPGDNNIWSAADISSFDSVTTGFTEDAAGAPP